jgi:hypothetical protein
MPAGLPLGQNTLCKAIGLLPQFMPNNLGLFGTDL